MKLTIMAIRQQQPKMKAITLTFRAKEGTAVELGGTWCEIDGFFVKSTMASLEKSSFFVKSSSSSSLMIMFDDWILL